MDKKTFYIVGGIGDILQSFSGIKIISDTFGEENIKCFLFSHYKEAKNLLKEYNFEIEFHYYENSEQLASIYQNMPQLMQDSLGAAEDWNTTLYPDILNKNSNLDTVDQLINTYIDFQENNIQHTDLDLIGIHPFGSNFSNEFIKKQMKLPGKNIPIELILEFIKYTQKRYPTKYFIFGHPSEIEYFNILKYNVDKITNTKILVPIFKNDIWTAINAISICDMILSADSAVKSASCILKIPTIVLLGDYEDKIRDDKFITPYETDGVLHTIKFLTLEKNTNGILSRIYQKTGELLKK